DDRRVQAVPLRVGDDLHPIGADRGHDRVRGAQIDADDGFHAPPVLAGRRVYVNRAPDDSAERACPENEMPSPTWLGLRRSKDSVSVATMTRMITARVSDVRLMPRPACWIAASSD